MHSSVVLGDEGLGRRVNRGTTRQMSVTQLCFKLNPKEHVGYFWTSATSAQSQRTDGPASSSTATRPA
jgi:hypothetical protein